MMKIFGIFLSVVCFFTPVLKAEENPARMAYSLLRQYCEAIKKTWPVVKNAQISHHHERLNALGKDYQQLISTLENLVGSETERLLGDPDTEKLISVYRQRVSQSWAALLAETQASDLSSLLINAGPEILLQIISLQPFEARRDLAEKLSDIVFTHFQNLHAEKTYKNLEIINEAGMAYTFRAHSESPIFSSLVITVREVSYRV